MEITKKRLRRVDNMVVRYTMLSLVELEHALSELRECSPDAFEEVGAQESVGHYSTTWCELAALYQRLTGFEWPDRMDDGKPFRRVP